MKRQAALITGSSRGIGLGAAVELAREGFAIAINGPADDDELSRAVTAVAAEGVPVIAAPFDVTGTSEHDRHLARIEAEIGPLTTLVNNAGVGVEERGDILDVTAKSYDRCLAVNARAMFFLSQAFAKRLIARQRSNDLFHSIVNVTSSNAVAVALPRAEYAVSKAAASMISKSFAVRLGGEGIHVYDIQPGLISTDMTAPVIDSYQQRAKDGLTILPRVGTAEETGRVIAAVAAGRLPYTTGQVISVDGGLLIPRY